MILSAVIFRFWRTAQFTFIFFLCFRFIAGAFAESADHTTPTLLLVTTCFVLGLRAPRSGAWAFTAALPLLNGLSQTAFLSSASPTTLCFSALALGWITRELLQPAGSRVVQLSSGDKQVELVLVDVLSTAIFISLTIQFLQLRAAPTGIEGVFTQASFGFGDKRYFITSGFLWLQGLFYFRYFITKSFNAFKWITSVFKVYAVTIAAFFVVQYIFRVPDPFYGFACFLPYEDISSFGSVVVSLFAFFITAHTLELDRNSIRYFIIPAGLGIMVIACWSRATWLAALVTLSGFTWLRAGTKWFLKGLLILALVVVGVNLQNGNPTWRDSFYLTRLLSLAKFENPMNKHAGRIDLYAKALRMIADRPVTGHGIGSFYLKSVHFANTSEKSLYPNLPDFAHNTLAQVAVELGLPSALAFAGLLTSVFCRAGLAYRGNKLDQRKRPKVVAGMFCLAIYFATQMTANSLNVYISNQFFFWFVVCAVYSAGRPGSYHNCTFRLL